MFSVLVTVRTRWMYTMPCLCCPRPITAAWQALQKIQRRNVKAWYPWIQWKYVLKVKLSFKRGEKKCLAHLWAVQAKFKRIIVGFWLWSRFQARSTSLTHYIQSFILSDENICNFSKLHFRYETSRQKKKKRKKQTINCPIISLCVPGIGLHVTCFPGWHYFSTEWSLFRTE